MQSTSTVKLPADKTLYFYTIILIRSLAFVLLILALDRATGIGTSPLVLGLGALTGTIIGSYVAFSRINTLGSITLLVSLLLIFYLVATLLNLFSAYFMEAVFSFYILAFHSEFILLFFSIAFLSTWFFWRSKTSVTIEILFLTGFAIYLLSGHRNYHLDMPRMVNSLAWSFGVDYLTMLILLGVFISTLVLLFLSTAGLRIDPFSTSQNLSRGNIRGFLAICILCFVALLFYFVSKQVYSYHYETVLTRTAHGVGQDNSEEISPLEFHSALGSTNQPSALVRLESDYNENPFSPMLYFRESALSAFNGRELVGASRNKNQDVTYTSPDQVYEGTEDETLKNRSQVVQSIHLLSNHKNAFAIDYPVKIRQLQNPNPARFRQSYRAYSVAPGYTREELRDASVGDPRWSDSELEHFLIEHSDPRYRELALQIAPQESSAVEKAFAVIDYLSKNSIYTLTPHHDTGPEDDPVAPYLFGDMRGYCVHFAHATVFLLRSLRVPARIATGYLTDYSQARDGHVLLRMSDRHAWAEVFITGKGWVPFDTHPDQVENHADTDVDVNLLEELMNMLGPDQEILPDEVWSGEEGLYETSSLSLPDKKFIVLPAAFILMLVIMAKLFLLFGWALPGSAEAKVRRTYLTIISILFDLGLKRRDCETRLEFEKRVSDTLKISAEQTTKMINRIIYAKNSDSSPIDEHAYNTSKVELSSFSSLSALQKAQVALNPFSALLFLLRQKW